jgi:hypothetical protein
VATGPVEASRTKIGANAIATEPAINMKNGRVNGPRPRIPASRTS